MGIRSVFHHIGWLLKGVKVFALVGKSGTGKSFRAQLVAQKHGINLIIDDGLLIKDQKILAGKSAKREKGMLSAVRTALFTDDDHAREVREILKNTHFKRILIIGTSIEMTKRIASRLGLPSPSRTILIEEIATTEEIEHAQKVRNEEGKHIIPVPAIEVKKNYPHIFFESIRILFRNRLPWLRKAKEFEKTVVRPEYSKKGKVAISESALTQMVLHCVNEFNPDIIVDKIILKKEETSYGIEVIVNIPYGLQMSGELHELQRYILESLEQFTGIILDEVSITVGKVSLLRNMIRNNKKKKKEASEKTQK